MKTLDHFEKPARAAVIGATGGIGSALVERLARTEGIERVYACARSPADADSDRVVTIPVDLEDEDAIRQAAERVTKDGSLDLVIVASGLLHRGEALQPEKSIRDFDARAFADVFAVNTIGPALAVKHFLPALARKRRTVFAALSARVGSIADNRIGGWAAYRASKAALNMILKTAAIEHARRNPDSVVAALHPGTVDTGLSQPFTGRVPESKLFTPDQAANYLLTVIDGLTPDDSGGFFAWDGERIEY